MKDLKIGLAQINSIIGDFEGNFKIIRQYIREAKQEAVDLLIFPELAVSGYPPQDLIFREGFIPLNQKYLDEIAALVPEDMLCIIGFVEKMKEKYYNAAALIQNGKIRAVRRKTLLPNYDVFDEKRYFAPSVTQEPVSLDFKGENLSLGIEICEDLWDEESPVKVTQNLVEKGADIIINISASPFEKGKREVRNQLVFDKVNQLGVPFVLVNYCGAQDEIIFAGNSIACDRNGNIIALGEEFREGFYTGIISENNTKTLKVCERPVEEALFNALVLGVRDYFRKTGHQKAVLGLSGGIDSALVAVIAARALGPENLTCIAMPSQYTSGISTADAKTLADNLGVSFHTLPIDTLYQTFKTVLAPLFSGMEDGLAEENIQARTRGNIIMSIANKFGALMLNTGNKTELALGYCTMYGDMAGALGVIGDLSKTDVYNLSKFINKKAGKGIIPERIITRPPSAELKNGQIDPFDYEIVSPLVDEIINNGADRESLLKKGYEAAVVDDCLRRIRFSEYKRKQAAPALKVSKKAFGIGRRYPIVNKY